MAFDKLRNKMIGKNDGSRAYAYKKARFNMAANTAMEMAVVGPETRCQLEPNSAATMVGTMAA